MIIRFLLLLTLATLATPALAQHVADASPGAPATLTGLSDGLAFVENRGQWDDKVLFRARLGGGTAWVTRDTLVFDFYEVEQEERDADASRREEPETVRRRSHVVAMRFEGAPGGPSGTGRRKPTTTTS